MATGEVFAALVLIKTIDQETYAVLRLRSIIPEPRSGEKPSHNIPLD